MVRVFIQGSFWYFTIFDGEFDMPREWRRRGCGWIRRWSELIADLDWFIFELLWPLFTSLIRILLSFVYKSLYKNSKPYLKTKPR